MGGFKTNVSGLKYTWTVAADGKLHNMVNDFYKAWERNAIYSSK